VVCSCGCQSGKRHYEQGTASKTSQSFLGGTTCVIDIFARSGALSFEGVSQNVRLTAFRRQTRAQAKQFAPGDLLFSLGVRVGHFEFAKRAQLLACRF